MVFTVYKIEKSDRNFVISTENQEIIGEGLSSGEVRQTILDGIKNDFSHNRLKNTIDDMKRNLNYDTDNTQEKDILLNDIENVLYEADDEEIHETMWHNYNDSIYVVGEKE